MITQAAILDQYQKIWTIVRPARHGNILFYMKFRNPELIDQVMGFIDENNKFYTREEAWKHAIECGQTFYVHNPMDPSKRFVWENPDPTGKLTSEDLW